MKLDEKRFHARIKEALIEFAGGGAVPVADAAAFASHVAGLFIGAAAESCVCMRVSEEQFAELAREAFRRATRERGRKQGGLVS